MGKKGDLIDFECGIDQLTVGARRAGLSIFKNCRSTGIFKDNHLGFTENGQKNRKYPVSGSCVDGNALFDVRVRGEWANWLEMIERNSNNHPL